MPVGDEKCSCDANDGSFSIKNRKAKAKILLPKRIGSIFTKSLGRKKSPGVNLSRKNNNRGALDGSRELSVTTQALPGPEKIARQPRLSISHSIKRMLENRGRFNGGGKDSERSGDAGKQALHMFTPHRLSKSIGFNFTKGTVHKTSNGDTNANGKAGGGCLVREKGSDDRVTGKQRRPKIVPSVPSRKPGGDEKIDDPKFLEKKMTILGEGTDHGRENPGKIELCKRRILMGGRCRPLHRSGGLHYDENGILLPEEILPFEKL